MADPGVYLAGASGGVYALLLAHLASILLVIQAMFCLLLLKQIYNLKPLLLFFIISELERNGIRHLATVIHLCSRWG